MKHYLGVCLVLLTIATIVLAALYSCEASVDRSIGKVRDAFVQVLQIQPQIVVNEKVIQGQTAPIAELAVVTKEEQVTLGFTEHLAVLSFQLPLTEKDMTVETTYRIKAGFDLREPFRVRLDPRLNRVQAEMPHAKILSVEQVGDLTYHGADSILNRISDEERAKLLDELNSAAHAQAESSTLKAEAEAQVSARLEELLQHNGESVELKWTSDNSPAIK